MTDYNLAEERALWPKLVGLSDAEAIVWLDDFYCDACYGCEDCQHICHRSDEERQRILDDQDEVLTVGMTMVDGEVRELSNGKLLRLAITANPAGGPCRSFDYVTDEA